MTDQQEMTFTEGMSVHGSDGGKVGEIVGAHRNYIVVEKGFFFPTDYYIPTSAIANLDEDRITLNITKDEALNQGWDNVPTEEELASYDSADTAPDDTWAAAGAAGMPGGAGMVGGMGTAAAGAASMVREEAASVDGTLEDDLRLDDDAVQPASQADADLLAPQETDHSMQLRSQTASNNDPRATRPPSDDEPVTDETPVTRDFAASEPSSGRDEKIFHDRPDEDQSDRTGQRPENDESTDTGAGPVLPAAALAAGSTGVAGTGGAGAAAAPAALIDLQTDADDGGRNEADADVSDEEPLVQPVDSVTDQVGDRSERLNEPMFDDVDSSFDQRQDEDDDTDGTIGAVPPIPSGSPTG